MPANAAFVVQRLLLLLCRTSDQRIYSSRKTKRFRTRNTCQSSGRRSHSQSPVQSLPVLRSRDVSRRLSSSRRSRSTSLLRLLPFVSRRLDVPFRHPLLLLPSSDHLLLVLCTFPRQRPNRRRRSRRLPVP